VFVMRSQASEVARTERLEQQLKATYLFPFSEFFISDDFVEQEKATDTTSVAKSTNLSQDLKPFRPSERLYFNTVTFRTNTPSAAPEGRGLPPAAGTPATAASEQRARALCFCGACNRCTDTVLSAAAAVIKL